MVLDLAADRDEDRLVVADQADDVVAGDVGRGDDDDLRPVERGVEVEADEAGVGVGRADRGAEPGAGEDEVVGVLRLAGQLVGALAAERAGAARPAGGRSRRGVDDERVRARSVCGATGAWSGWAGSGSSCGAGRSLLGRTIAPATARGADSAQAGRTGPLAGPVWYRMWGMPVGRPERHNNGLTTSPAAATSVGGDIRRATGARRPLDRGPERNGRRMDDGSGSSPSRVANPSPPGRIDPDDGTELGDPSAPAPEPARGCPRQRPSRRCRTCESGGDADRDRRVPRSPRRRAGATPRPAPMDRVSGTA